MLRKTEQCRLLFVLNHNAEMIHVALPAGARFWDHLRECSVAGTLALPGYGVSILQAQAGTGMSPKRLGRHPTIEPNRGHLAAHLRHR
jgi:hypothetical protein